MSLEAFNEVNFVDLDELFLQTRKEIKFFFAESELNGLLETLENDFDIIVFDGMKIQQYASSYLDSSELDNYVQHHNKWKNRYKIRFRDYVKSGLSFIEVKHKQNSGVTVKNRLEIPFESREITDEIDQFISEFYPHDIDHLEFSIDTEYDRISFVSKDGNARITIDKNLRFKESDLSENAENLVVLELKYNALYPFHNLRRKLKDINIYPNSISKYCLGICLLKENIKKNNFKLKLLKVESIKQQSECS